VSISASKEMLVKLLHVSFVGLWVAGEFDDSKQATCNESLEDARRVCRSPWEIEVQVQVFSKSIEVTRPSLMERVMSR